ncbi:MAG: GNAT family N-acetyltransferase [Clostridiales bacterium]|jgi:RimJ/RimL family protein N-acetyltransferase|nr:GNAT family N-acetyltransferase [Clostridiales bacterium]
MRYFRKISGERLYLSPINDEDIEVYAKWMNDPDVAVSFGFGHRAFSLFLERKELEHFALDQNVFAIVAAANDELLGNAFFMDMNHIYRSAEVGIFIGEARNRGGGYGAEALSLIVGYGFEMLNLHSIMLHVHADNAQAQACYGKVGFRECGRRTDAVFKNGKYVDMLSMEILDNEFAGRKQQARKERREEPCSGAV